MLPNALSATIAPNFPLSKTAVQTVKATEIFGVNTRSVLSTIPIVGVRLLYGQDGNDAGKTGKDKQIFAQYPPAADKIEGIYEYVRPPAWAILTKNINLGKPSNVKQLGRKDEPQHKKNIVTPDKKNGKLTQNEIQLWADKLAKTMYNTRVWAKNSFTMSVPLNFNVCPGMVIAIDVSSDNVARKIFGGSVIYGQVQGVSIKSSVGRYSMNVSVAYVRNKKENDKCGFTEHPLYDKYKMEKIELY